MNAIARHLLAHERIEAVFHKFRVLPRTLVLIMDNTSRENKNQIMVKIMAELVLLRVFEHIWLAFPQKGHTHGPLDAVFGQATVKMANNCSSKLHMAKYGSSKFENASTIAPSRLQIANYLQSFLVSRNKSESDMV